MTTSDHRLLGRVGFHVDGVILRRMAHAGARHGPRWWLRYSPPVFGLAFAALLPEQRARIRAHLRRVLGERRAVDEHLDVARTFCSYAHCLAESLASGRAEAEQASYTLHGGEWLREVGAGGGGFIVGTAHLGAWDSAARLLARDVGRPVAVVMVPEGDLGARELHDAARTREDVTVVHVEHPLDALTLLRHLRDGGVVAVQLDRVVPGGRSVASTLFDLPFRVPEGPFQLAAAAGCPLLPVFAGRTGHFDYAVHVGEPITLPRRPGTEGLEASARAACAEMERFIRAYPTQWFQFGG